MEQITELTKTIQLALQMQMVYLQEQQLKQSELLQTILMRQVEKKIVSLHLKELQTRYLNFCMNQQMV